MEIYKNYKCQRATYIKYASTQINTTTIIYELCTTIDMNIYIRYCTLTFYTDRVYTFHQLIPGNYGFSKNYCIL